MGVINATNLMSFKSSRPLFARVKKRLSSFDAAGLIDDDDFHEYVKYILTQLGQAVYKECEAILHVKDYKAKLPSNLLKYHAVFKCTPTFNKTKTINEQRPWIFHVDLEEGRDCTDTCCIKCGVDQGKRILIARTFVNGDDLVDFRYKDPTLLKLSSNVRDLCDDACLSLFSSDLDEITIDDNKVAHVNFTDDDIYIQYFGLPIDEKGLPMIPDNTTIEKAIEYYIYSQLFEDFKWNSTVANITDILVDARNQYEFYFGQARYFVKLPTFESMVNSLRHMRARNKFWYFPQDKTISKF